MLPPPSGKSAIKALILGGICTRNFYSIYRDPLSDLLNNTSTLQFYFLLRTPAREPKLARTLQGRELYEPIRDVFSSASSSFPRCQSWPPPLKPSEKTDSNSLYKQLRTVACGL